MNAKRRKLQNSKVTIHDIPAEVFRDILQLLDFNTVFNFSSCCQYFRFVTTEGLQNVNLFRLVVSKDMFHLLKDAGHHILELNLNHAPALTAVDLVKSCRTMVNLVTLDISHTGLTIPSFVRISRNLPRLKNLTMDLLYSKVRIMRPKIFKNNIFNQYKAAFSNLKLIHFHAQDWILHDALWQNSLSILENAVELFELRLTLYHQNHEFINIIPGKLGSALKLPFKKLTISTATVRQDVFYSMDYLCHYFTGSDFFEKLISDNWQFVLFRASEGIFEKVTMSHHLFDIIKMHHKDIEDKVTVNHVIGVLIMNQCVLHLWHPSLFENNSELSKEIAVEIEKKIPKEVQGNNASVFGLHLTISEDEWKEAEKNISAGILAKQIAIAENLTQNINLNILENITAFVLADIESFRDVFFNHLFLQCRHLETFILRCASSDEIHHMACKSIHLAQNLKTLQLSGYFLNFKRWLTQLGNCKKIENVEFRCAIYLIPAGPQALICRADLFKFINKSKHLKCLLVGFQFCNYQDPEDFLKKVKALKESLDCAIEKFNRKTFHFTIIDLGEFTNVDTQCEEFFPIYSKFLKPLQNLKLKYEQ